MKYTVYLFMVVVVISQEWGSWKERHGKHYGIMEDMRRQAIFRENWLEIETHNQ